MLGGFVLYEKVMLMRIYIEKGFSFLIRLLAFISAAILVLILLFIFKESMGLFNRVSLYSFLFGTEWEPLGANPQVSIKAFIAATIFVAIIAIAIAIPIGVGFSMAISVLLPEKLGRALKACVNILAGIPSVVYGFIGLSVLVKSFEKYFSFSTGESVLVAGILLSIMILPYVVSTCSETINKINKKYKIHSYALVESKWYMMNNLILPACKGSIIASAILATGRAMGETMAVMMVIGNSPLMPEILGKSETISALIALEMGSAQIGSLHYHALFAAGFTLMILLLLINALFYSISRRINL